MPFRLALIQLQNIVANFYIILFLQYSITNLAKYKIEHGMKEPKKENFFQQPKCILLMFTRISLQKMYRPKTGKKARSKMQHYLINS